MSQSIPDIRQMTVNFFSTVYSPAGEWDSKAPFPKRKRGEEKTDGF
jgi:hypothetical protein